MEAYRRTILVRNNQSNIVKIDQGEFIESNVTCMTTRNIGETITGNVTRTSTGDIMDTTTARVITISPARSLAKNSMFQLNHS